MANSTELRLHNARDAIKRKNNKFGNVEVRRSSPLRSTNLKPLPQAAFRLFGVFFCARDQDSNPNFKDFIDHSTGIRV